MSSNGKSQIMEGMDLEGVITTSLKKQLPRADERVPGGPGMPHPPTRLAEAYVAEAKPYSLVTEFLSQKAKDAHTQLYKSYVETLNRVSSELDTAERSKADSKHSEFRSLKLDETYNLN